jgi:lysine 2,3-aminomutase
MERYPSGLDPRIIKLREENRERTLNIIIDKIDQGELSDAKYKFTREMSREQKFLLALDWWKESSFHLKFAARNPDLLNEMLGYSLDPDTMKILYSAEKAGIPFFVNPYYLSLLHVRTPYFAIGADQAIRNYIIYSPQLINEFGNIVAWEKVNRMQPAGCFPLTITSTGATRMLPSSSRTPWDAPVAASAHPASGCIIFSGDY